MANVVLGRLTWDTDGVPSSPVPNLELGPMAQSSPGISATLGVLLLGLGLLLGAVLVVALRPKSSVPLTLDYRSEGLYDERWVMHRDTSGRLIGMDTVRHYDSMPSNRL